MAPLLKRFLLQAPREGALAFLARLDETLNDDSDAPGLLQYALLEITPETRNNFEWKPDEIQFLTLALSPDTKGLSYV